jgi:hypothetical protein
MAAQSRSVHAAAWLSARGLCASRHRASAVFRPRWLKRALLFVTAFFILYCGVFVTSRSVAMRLVSSNTLEWWPLLRSLADRMTPAPLLAHGPGDVALQGLLLGAIITGLLGAWIACVRAAHSRWCSFGTTIVIGGILLFSVPLVLMPGLLSTDLFLHMYYGRIVAVHHENPFLAAPNYFGGDPQLESVVHWSWLPSAYGPLWILLCGMLSAIMPNALVTTLVIYKTAMVLLHVSATVILTLAVRQRSPDLALSVGVAYGWNPLVLIETVGGAHTEALMVALLAAVILSATSARWSIAAGLLGLAIMVKIVAVIFLPVLLASATRSLPTVARRARAAVTLAGVAAATALTAYVPLWAGFALIENVRMNPAAETYYNSIWESLALFIAAPSEPQFLSVLETMTIARTCVIGLLSGVAIWMAARDWTFSRACTWTGIASGRPREIGLAYALTCGGLLFWISFPEAAGADPLGLYRYRSLLLLGPALAYASYPLLAGIVHRAARQAQSAVPWRSAIGTMDRKSKPIVGSARQ